MAHRLVTERLVLRPWSVDDADAALRAYGDAEVARWLAPAMDKVSDLAAMRVVLQQWAAEDTSMLTPAGRWAIELPQEGRVIGGATLLPLSPDEEFEIGWQLQRDAWGHGYAAETGLALARWAFGQGIEQVIALGRHLNVPVVSKSPEEAAAHFGFLGPFLSADLPASSALTQKWLGWRPTQPGLIADIDHGRYFETETSTTVATA